MLFYFLFLFFFYSEGQFFSFMARIPTVVRGCQYNYAETVPIERAKHYLFYFFMRKIQISPPCPN